jgi:CubicO group peptidase (beta-lactamase class C family)
MRREVVIIAAVLFLAASATPAAAAAPTAAKSTSLATFDSAMGGVIAEGYPGGSLAIVRDGKLVYARGYGFANKEMHTRATASTRYRQASISKPVTASLLRTMVAKNAVSLDLPVFPFLGAAPADARADLITVRDLMDHRSGIAGDYFFEAREAATFYGVASPPDADTMVRWTARYELAADPGSTYRYNNTNYALLTRVLERVAGRSWIDLLRDMGASAGINSWRLGVSLEQPRDEAYYYEASPWEQTTSVFDSQPGIVDWPYGGYSVESLGGAVSLVSTVVDMARYDLAVARGTIAAAEEKPIPTQPGWSYTYIYNGSMPGHYSFAMRIWNGRNLTIIAGAFNHRDLGAIDKSINQRVIDAYTATRAWPTQDLFPGY